MYRLKATVVGSMHVEALFHDINRYDFFYSGVSICTKHGISQALVVLGKML